MNICKPKDCVDCNYCSFVSKFTNSRNEEYNKTYICHLQGTPARFDWCPLELKKKWVEL
jgi:hypothetical protein